jgi:hypothetical protein
MNSDTNNDQTYKINNFLLSLICLVFVVALIFAYLYLKDYIHIGIWSLCYNTIPSGIVALLVFPALNILYTKNIFFGHRSGVKIKNNDTLNIRYPCRNMGEVALPFVDKIDNKDKSLLHEFIGMEYVIHKYPEYVKKFKFLDQYVEALKDAQKQNKFSIHTLFATRQAIKYYYNTNDFVDNGPLENTRMHRIVIYHVAQDQAYNKKLAEIIDKFQKWKKKSENEDEYKFDFLLCDIETIKERHPYLLRDYGIFKLVDDYKNPIDKKCIPATGLFSYVELFNINCFSKMGGGLYRIKEQNYLERTWRQFDSAFKDDKSLRDDSKSNISELFNKINDKNI